MAGRPSEWGRDEEKNLSGQSDARGRRQEKPALQGAQSNTSTHRCRKVINMQREKKKKSWHSPIYLPLW